MKYLITGGAGFIGAYTVSKLLVQGKEAVVYDSNLRQGIIERVIPEAQLKRVRLVQGSITDLSHLMNPVKENGVSIIIHLAALQIPACQANPPLAIEVDCTGTANIFETARILGLQRVVWASSIGVFGPGEEYGNKKVPNDAYHRPGTVYGSCKSLCETLASHYMNDYDVDSIGFRFTGVYGLGRNRGKTSFTTTMIEKAALGQPYTVPFSTDLYDWQFVEDVAAVTVLATQAPKTRTRVFNTQGDVRPVMEGVEYLKRLIPGTKFALEPGTVGIAWEYDTTPLEKELGFKPACSMEEGILKVLNAFRKEAKLPLIRP